MKNVKKVLDEEVSISMKFGELLVLQNLCIGELAIDHDNGFARTILELTDRVIDLKPYHDEFFGRVNHEN